MSLFRPSRAATTARDGEPLTGPLVGMRGVEKAFDTSAGKSTLLSILGMFDGAWTGEFVFRNQPVHTLAGRERLALNRKHIGFVFQQYHLLDDLTVAENLDVPLSYRDVPRERRAAMVADALDRAGVTIVQVTHSEENAQYGSRIIALRDGWIVSDEPTTVRA